MSVFATAWAWQQPATGNAKLVLLALADECRGSDGLCWPGLKRVAEMVGVEQRTVRRAVEQLEEAGLLIREQRRREDGSQTSNLIRLAILPTPPDAAVRGGEDASVLPRAVKEEPGKPSASSPEGSHSENDAEWITWLRHHEKVTETITLKPGTAATKNVLGMFKARIAEGYSMAELCLAVDGAWADEYRRENGHTGPESVLRPTKVADLIAKGRRARQQAEAVSPYDALEDR
jgi:DNA-binding transcriptional ArsR family regulator